MVRQVGWGGNRGRLGRWGDLGPGSVPLLPMPLPPLPPPPCRGPGRGRISIFSLSPAPHTRSSPSSVPPPALGPPCPAMQAPGGSQPPHSDLPTPTTQAGPAMTPSSAPPSWGSHSTPPLAPVTPPPSHRCPQDPPGLRIGPLIPEQDYERLEDCDPEGSQDSPLHGEEQQPLLHVPEGLRGECGCGAARGARWGGPGGSRGCELGAQGRAKSQHSPLCAQAPGTISRTWTASSPRYPLCSAWQHWRGRALWCWCHSWPAALRAQWVAEVRERCLRERPFVPQASFLTHRHIYSYHQRNGFACILLEDVFQLG